MDEYIVDNNTYLLPLLVNTTLNGKKQYWSIYVIENKIYRDTWIETGKKRQFPVLEIQGKTNRTTDHEQALKEGYRKWLNQMSKGYTRATQQQEQLLLPMLAQKFTERKKYIKYPCAVSKKLDGIRMISCFKDGKIVLTSRTGKEFMHVEKVRQHVQDLYSEFGNIILDGELYSHDLPFSVISGAIRSIKKKSIHDHLLEYWIFDVIDVNTDYKTRAQLLQKMEEWYNSSYSVDDRVLKFELYTLVDKETQIQEYHDVYVSQGFEGLIIRNLDGKYIIKHRTNDLQKFKNFEDTEYKIVGYKLGTGTEAGAIIFECEFSPGKTFDVRPRGSISERIEKAKKGNTFIGKQLTVRYQPCVKQSDVEKNELPRFPIGLEIRDYE
jgi:DNA ligase 1